MNKIINGVASEYDMPMKYENKTTTIFIDKQDMEERYGEQLYQNYLKEQNEKLQQENNKLKKEKEDLYERINKTIKYVESLEYDDYGTGYYDIGENHYDKLLEMLKGSDNNE